MQSKGVTYSVSKEDTNRVLNGREWTIRNSKITIKSTENSDVAVVAARRGHAQITTTFNFYVHPIISHNRQAGSVLENLLLPQKLV